MNSDLYGNIYNIPDEVLNQISISLQKFKKINTNGKKRAANFLREKTITYQNLKRLKNYFENLPNDFDAIEYELIGGNLMKNFVNNLLEKERENIERGKRNRTQAGMENQFNKTHQKDQLVSRTNNFLTNESINTVEEMKFVSLGFIFNKNMEILLLKRSKNDDWCPDLYALPGGGSDENETPEDTIKREIKEECGVNIISSKHFSTIIKNGVTEHLFLVKPSDLNIKINEEHSDFNFFKIDYIKNNPTQFVPNLLNYIKLIKK